MCFEMHKRFLRLVKISVLALTVQLVLKTLF